MFALNLITEVNGLYTFLVGWIVIAISLSVIGTLQLAGRFLIVNRALQQLSDPGLQTNGSLLNASSALERRSGQNELVEPLVNCHIYPGR